MAMFILYSACFAALALGAVLEKPSHEQEKTLHELEKPLYELEKPLHELEKPLHELEKLLYEQEKPLHELEKPLHELEKPLYELEKSRELFREFLEEYEKSYGDDIEHEHRHGIFLENLKRINDLNGRRPTSVHAINMFADLSHEEFVTSTTCFSPPKPVSTWNLTEYLEDVKDIPENFDWRDKGIVNPVRNQGQCGSCWAFSSMATVESQYALKHKELVTLAEQQLVDCDRSDSGCNGGSMYIAFDYLNRTGGAMVDKEYPYKATEGSCAFDKTKVKVKVTGETRSGSVKEEDIKALVYKYGPVSAGLNARAMGTYHGGIDTPSDKECSPEDTNHAVNIVGYGVENGTKYWVIRNSWGEKYGENGYYRLEMGRNACGVTSYIASATVE